MTTLIEAAITAAVLAERYRADARENPERAAGWMRMADRWSAVAERLLCDLVEAADRQTPNVSRLPSPATAARHGRS